MSATSETGHGRPHLTLKGVGAQGAILFCGIGLSQGLSFARNALLGHALSPRDFGIAASITLLLQLVETLSDLGHDRLIVQADDGDSDSFLATTHTVAAARGVLLALLIAALSPFATRFFGAGEAANAFMLVALVPLIKGFVHLDSRRAQRRLDNRPQLTLEVVPQAIALTATLPVLAFVPGFMAAVVLAILQAAAAVAVARSLTRAPYRLGCDEDVLRRLLAFGWPILLSALPLAVVYQGDRAIIGRISGLEALAAYSAAFMITMVPGLLAARAGHALMLPVFSTTLRNGQALTRRFCLLAEATVILAALYLTVFIVAGGKLLPIAFGPAYGGHDALLAALAGMWALRMIQAVPGMALMASGETKPFLIAGIIRASVLPAALYAALHGASLAGIAATGCAGELASLLYISWRVERLQSGLACALLARALFLVPVAVAAALIAGLGGDTIATALAAAAGLLAILGAGIAIMPGMLVRARRALAHVFSDARLKHT